MKRVWGETAISWKPTNGIYKLTPWLCDDKGLSQAAGSDIVAIITEAKNWNNWRSVKFYAWIDIIECTNIESNVESLKFDGSYFKSNLFRRCRTYNKYRRLSCQWLIYKLEGPNDLKLLNPAITYPLVIPEVSNSLWELFATQTCMYQPTSNMTTFTYL